MPKKEEKFKKKVSFELKDNKAKKGVIQGTLINHSVIDSYGDVFTKESITKIDTSVTKLLLHQHEWSDAVGTLETFLGDDGSLKFTGYFDLSFNDSGQPNNPVAHKLYSLMKQGASYEMSAGGTYIDVNKETFEGKQVFMIKEFDLYEGSIVVKGAVPGASVEYVKTNNKNNGGKEMAKKMDKFKRSRIKKKLKTMKKEDISAVIEDVASSEDVTIEEATNIVDEIIQEVVDEAAAEIIDNEDVTLSDEEAEEQAKEGEEEGNNEADLEKTDESEEEKNTDEEDKIEKKFASMQKSLDSIDKGIRGGVKLNTTNTQLIRMKKKLNDDLKFEKLTRPDVPVLIPELVANEILKDIQDISTFFGEAYIYTGEGSEIKIPVRDETIGDSIKALGEAEGNTGYQEYKTTDLVIGAGVLQSRFTLSDEVREDSNFDVFNELEQVTVEHFEERLASLITNGVVAGKNYIEGFMQTTTNGVVPFQTKTAGVVKWTDLIDLMTSIRPKYRLGAKFFVSPKLHTEMLKWVDGNGRPLLTQFQSPDGVYGYIFYGHEVIVDYYMQDPTTGKFPVLFCDFNKFYAMFIRKNPFETEIDRRVNERMTDYYTRCRLGGRVVRPYTGALLQVK